MVIKSKSFKKGEPKSKYTYNHCKEPGCLNKNIYLYRKPTITGATLIWLCKSHCQDYLRYYDGERLRPTTIYVEKDTHRVVVKWIKDNFESLTMSELFRGLENEIFEMIKSETTDEEISFSFKGYKIKSEKE